MQVIKWLKFVFIVSAIFAFFIIPGFLQTESAVGEAPSDLQYADMTGGQTGPSKIVPKPQTLGTAATFSCTNQCSAPGCNNSTDSALGYFEAQIEDGLRPGQPLYQLIQSSLMGMKFGGGTTNAKCDVTRHSTYDNTLNENCNPVQVACEGCLSCPSGYTYSDPYNEWPEDSDCTGALADLQCTCVPVCQGVACVGCNPCAPGYEATDNDCTGALADPQCECSTLDRYNPGCQGCVPCPAGYTYSDPYNEWPEDSGCTCATCDLQCTCVPQCIEVGCGANDRGCGACASGYYYTDDCCAANQGCDSGCECTTSDRYNPGCGAFGKGCNACASGYSYTDDDCVCAWCDGECTCQRCASASCNSGSCSFSPTSFDGCYCSSGSGCEVYDDCCDTWSACDTECACCNQYDPGCGANGRGCNACAPGYVYTDDCCRINQACDSWCECARNPPTYNPGCVGCNPCPGSYPYGKDTGCTGLFDDNDCVCCKSGNTIDVSCGASGKGCAACASGYVYTDDCCALNQACDSECECARNPPTYDPGCGANGKGCAACPSGWVYKDDCCQFWGMCDGDCVCCASLNTIDVSCGHSGKGCAACPAGYHYTDDCCALNQACDSQCECARWGKGCGDPKTCVDLYARIDETATVVEGALCTCNPMAHSCSLDCYSVTFSGCTSSCNSQWNDWNNQGLTCSSCGSGGSCNASNANAMCSCDQTCKEMCDSVLCGWIECDAWYADLCGDILTYKIKYEGMIYDGAGGSGQGVAGDGVVLYYDTINVSLTPNTAQQQYNLNINISNVSRGKVALDTLHFEAQGVPILGCVSNSSAYATMDNINVTGSLRLKVEQFQCGGDTYVDGDGRDWELIDTVEDCQTYHSVEVQNCPTGYCGYPCNQDCTPPSPPVWECVEDPATTYIDCDASTCNTSQCRFLDVEVNISNVTINNLYVEVFNCDSWPPGLGWLCNWINGLVSGWLSDSLSNTLKGVLQNTLDDMLRSSAGLPLDMTVDILKDPFNFAKGCVNPGIYPTNCPNPMEVGTKVSEIPLSCALRLQEEGVPQDPECSKYVGLPPDYYYGKKAGFPSWCDVDYTASPPYSLPSGTNVTWPNLINGQDYHFGLGFNQDSVTEILNVLYKTGFLCIEATNEESDAGFVIPLGDMLKVETLSTIIPGLLSTAQPGTYAKIRFVPKGSPVAYNNWCIAFSTSYASKNCESGQGHRYDVAFKFPNVRIDLLAKPSPTSPYVKAFSINWRWIAGLDVQAVHTCHPLDENCFSLPPGAQMYLQVFMDLDTTPENILFTGYVPPSEREGYISDFLYTLLNASIGTTFKTAFRLKGINYSLLYLGPFNPSNLSLYDGSDADCLLDAQTGNCISSGRTWTDYFGAYMKFIGNIDFNELFGAFGAPPYKEVAPETYVSLDGGEGVSEVSLSPIDASAIGLGEHGAVIKVSGEDPQGRPLRYSYKIDGGVWSVPGDVDKIVLPRLADGPHTIEVRAFNDMNVGDPTPAKIEFVSDKSPPMIWVAGPYKIKGKGETALVVRVLDAVDPPDAVKVSYAVDGGKGERKNGGTIYVPVDSLSTGSHTILVVAEDSLGHRSEKKFDFEVTGSEEEIEPLYETSYGCAFSNYSPGLSFVVFLLLVLTFFLALQLYSSYEL